MMRNEETNIDTKDIKRATTDYPVMDILKNRWSPRSFSDESISENNLATLFEAASWAPSSRNEQPWMYIYAHRSDKAFQKFINCLMPGNEPWAKNAAILVISIARKQFSNGKENRTYMHDTGLANMQLVLQAFNMNIYAHMMAGFDMNKTKESFQIPDELDIICFMALGYLDSPEKLPEPYKTREQNKRTRYMLSEFTFKNELT
jgi:nitroreductase